MPITMRGDTRWRPGRRGLRSPGCPFSTVPVRARWGGRRPPCPITRRPRGLGLGRPRFDRFERNCSCHTFAARVARWTPTPQPATARLTTARAAALRWHALCGGPDSMGSWSPGGDGSRSARPANHRRPRHPTRADECGAADVWAVPEVAPGDRPVSRIGRLVRPKRPDPWFARERRERSDGDQERSAHEHYCGASIARITCWYVRGADARSGRLPP